MIKLIINSNQVIPQAPSRHNVFFGHCNVFAHSHTQCARRAPWMLALTCSSVMAPSTRLKESVNEYSIMNCLALSPIAWSGEWTVLSRWFKVSPLAVASDRARFNAQIYRYTTCKFSLCSSSLAAIQDTKVLISCGTRCNARPAAQSAKWLPSIFHLSMLFFAICNCWWLLILVTMKSFCFHKLQSFCMTSQFLTLCHGIFSICTRFITLIIYIYILCIHNELRTATTRWVNCVLTCLC